MTQRTERIDELLRQEIGAILARDIQDPRIGFATITKVETAADLNHARVWVSVIGGDSEREETIRALQSAMSFVRRELGPKLRLKRIPMLHVKLDDSIERGSRVLHLLHEIEAGRSPDQTELVETLPTPVKRIRQDGDTAEPELPALPPIPEPEGKPTRGAARRSFGRRPEGRTGGAGGSGKPPRRGDRSGRA